jgi:hypothetical protein
MTPLEQIREGILEDDMSMVALGYKYLTGEDLEEKKSNPQHATDPPDPPTPQDEHFTDSSSVEDFIAPSKKKDGEAAAGRIARSSPVSREKRENQFVDDGSEHRDIDTPATELTPRQRDTFKMASQQCSKCNKTFEVHPVHRREHYLCDRCIIK